MEIPEQPRNDTHRHGDHTHTHRRTRSRPGGAPFCVLVPCHPWGFASDPTPSPCGQTERAIWLFVPEPKARTGAVCSRFPARSSSARRGRLGGAPASPPRRPALRAPSQRGVVRHCPGPGHRGQEAGRSQARHSNWDRWFYQEEVDSSNTGDAGPTLPAPPSHPCPSPPTPPLFPERETRAQTPHPRRRAR